MIEYRDECVGCPPEMGCLGRGCPRRNVAYLVCDKCENECEELYEYEGDQLCAECLLESVPKVEVGTEGEGDGW